jgi:hypothetical protein
MQKLSHRLSVLGSFVSAQAFVENWQIDPTLRADGTKVPKALDTVNSKILSNAAAAFNGKFKREEE